MRYQIQLTVSVVDANSARRAVEPVPNGPLGSDELFGQRILLDMVFVVVPFALRRAIRTENSGGYTLCGRPFRASMGYSNREIRLTWCLWSSLSRSGDQFEQRILPVVLCVAVPFARGHESRLRKGRILQSTKSLNETTKIS